MCEEARDRLTTLEGSHSQLKADHDEFERCTKRDFKQFATLAELRLKVGDLGQELKDELD